MVTKDTRSQQAADRRKSKTGGAAKAAGMSGQKRGSTGSGATSKAKSKPNPKPAAKPKPKPKPKTTAKPGAAAKPRAKGRFTPLTAKDVAEIFRRFRDIEPEPKGELEHSNAYTLLVAVVLSAQATDAGVNKATRGLFKLADTPAKMVALGEDRVREAIKTIGLYRNKAKNVIALSEKLLADHGGEVPADRDILETLPGVGRKTANVVMNVAFGQPTMAVDTHVFRVSNRIGFSDGTTPVAVEHDLVGLIPPEYGVPAHHWLILHGRYLCKARKPECYRCPIRELCRFEPKTPHA